MWSGPRNLSTALMRSFENRIDTKVWDEPLYAYYLNETKKKHPLCGEIINTYETNINKLIKLIISKNNKEEIYYQKHMTHHILENTPLDWIKNGINCFLIRDPKDVMLSYIKKNKINDANDIGFPMQIKLLNIVKEKKLKSIIINADDLSSNPKKILKILCNKLNISFNEKMLNWPIGKRNSDGIWGKIWYQNVYTSTNFKELKKNKLKIPTKYESIYEECLDIYNEINYYNILNEG